MHRRLITELPSRVINKWQVQGGDVCILPVGSVEVLGPHLPMGARTFVAEAFAKLLAEAGDGLYLPPVPLSPVAGAAGLPGTVDVSEPPVNRLLRALLDDMLKTGFRRILLVTYLDYARYYLPVEFYEDHEVAAAGIHLNEALWRPTEKRGIGNDSVMLGALKLLGRDELLAKCLDAAERWKAEGKSAAPLPEAYQEVIKIGVAGVRFPKGYYPMPPTGVIDPDAGAEVLREAAAEKVPALEDLRAYNEYLARRGSRGFLRGGWFRDEEGGAR
ncbi:MAG TPA: creatininase family protein [Planctomycetota bacterium]|nr:creatininase family protein [Planctomycetota bacterium]